jgi:DNA-binding NarL/FixJ family response regulator
MMHVAIADDHPIFRSGLKFLLEVSFGDIRVDQFENGQELVSYACEHHPDIVIVDIDMPVMNGLEVCEALTRFEVRSRIIVLTMYKDIEMLKLAFVNGARGYLVKDNTSEGLVDCIQTILKGNSYLDRTVREHGKTLFPEDRMKIRVREQIGCLTQTELKTLKLVSRKYSSREIADLLFISVKSVENCRSRICRKLNLDARNNNLLLWVIENKSVLDSIQEFG